MDFQNQEKIYAFDSLYTTNHIQMLKILLPCLTPPFQKNLALYIKFLEFSYTSNFIRDHPFILKGCGFEQNKTDLNALGKELLPYCSEYERQTIHQIINGMDSMKQMEQMKNMMKDMKDLFPDGFDFSSMFNASSSQDNGNSSNKDMKDLSSIFGQMTPEQNSFYEKMSEKFKDF